MSVNEQEAVIALILAAHWTRWLRQHEDADTADPEVRYVIEAIVWERRLARAGGIEAPSWQQLHRRRRR